jgi:spore germination protein YaaH
MQGEECFLKADYPLTDVAYFGAGLNSVGSLVGAAPADKISFFKGRKHLVVAEGDNYALTHFVLSPEFHLREGLINDIALASAGYDGVQIDFEAVLSKDKDNFADFLYSLKERLGGKTLSVALPAHTQDGTSAYDYARLNSIVDYIVVMAYDEHWSQSQPGSIASINWCNKVVSYALTRISPEKLIMGMPLYGRAWADKNPSRAYKYSTISRLLSEKQISNQARDNDIPYLEYQDTINVRMFYEDAQSISSRMALYGGLCVRNISFWRLGQEDPEFWKYLAPRD